MQVLAEKYLVGCNQKIRVFELKRVITDKGQVVNYEKQ